MEESPTKSLNESKKENPIRNSQETKKDIHKTSDRKISGKIVIDATHKNLHKEEPERRRSSQLKTKGHQSKIEQVAYEADYDIAD